MLNIIPKAKALLLFPAILLLLSVTRNSYAQPTGGDQAGAASARFDAQVRKAEEAAMRKRKEPEVEIEKEKKPVVPTGPAFNLTKITLSGNTIFKTEELTPIYKDYIGKKVTFADLQTITDLIKDRYKAKGYATVLVYLPEQDVKEGAVEIRIAEGRMGKLTIEGNRWYPSKLIRNYYHTKKNEILNVTRMERDILRLSNNPDIEIKSVLSQGKDPGTVDVTIKAKDFFPYYAGVMADNKGTRLSGKDRAMLTFRSTDMTANNDSFYMTLLYTSHSNAQAISYTLPIDTHGTKFGISYSHYNLQLGKEFKDITGDTKVITPYIEKELLLSTVNEAYLDVGLDVQSIKKHNFGFTTADDELRVPYASLQFTNNDLWGRTTIMPKISFGTGEFLGASKYNHPTASRPLTGGFFAKYEYSVTRIQRAFSESYIVLRVNMQASPQNLVPAEQIQIGGADTVRGYPEGDFLADTGAVASMDWIFPFFFMPKDIKMPYSDTPLRNQLQPIIFADFGGGRLNKAMTGERRDKFLAGVGGGFRIRLYKNVYCRFEWAQRVGAKPQEGAGTSNFHYSVQTEL